MFNGTLTGSLQELTLTLSRSYRHAQVVQIQNASEDLEAAVSPGYELFLEHVVTTLAKTLDQTPPRILKYGQYLKGAGGDWRDLSAPWLAKKSKFGRGGAGGGNDFYAGISGRSTLNTRNSRTRNTQTGVPLKTYLGSLKGRMNDIMGPLVIEYTFKATGKTFVTKNVYNTVEIVDVISDKTGKSLQFPSQFRLSTRILGFQKLLGTGDPSESIYAFDETAIAARLMNITGVTNQWYKLGSRKAWNHPRQVRAVIMPMISWWFNVVATPAMVQFKKALEGK